MVDAVAAPAPQPNGRLAEPPRCAPRAAEKAECATAVDPYTDRKEWEAFAASCLPCQLFRFVSFMYATFGGFVPMGIVQYGCNAGLAHGIGRLAIKYFFKDTLGLRDNPALMQNLQAAAKIPWNIKPVMGMLSDAYPLFGFHRTSYMAIAAAGGAVAYVCLGALPLAAFATLPFLVVINFSSAVPDIMIDATAASLSKEKPDQASNLQSMLMGSLPFGLLLACSVSGTMIEAAGPKAVLMLTAVCPLMLLVPTLLRWLPEERVPKGERKLNLSFLMQHRAVTTLAAVMSFLALSLSVLQVTIHSAKLRAIVVFAAALLLAGAVFYSLRRIRPILAKTALFIFARECLQPNLADPMFVWQTTNPDGPLFSAKFMGLLEGVGALALLLGVVIYNKFLTGVSYRRIFTFAQVSLALFVVFDFVLVKRWNLEMGIPDVVFVLADDAFGHLFSRFFMMPLFVLCAKVCPDSLEATLFSMLMALANFGSTVGDYFGSSLCDAFDIKNGNFDMLPEALIAKSVCRLMAIPLIWLLVPAITPDDPIPSDDADEDEHDEDEVQVCKVRSDVTTVSNNSCNSCTEFDADLFDAV